MQAEADDFRVAIPRVFRIEPAGLCNLRCKHCSGPVGRHKRGVMPDEVFAEVLSIVRRNAAAIKVIVLYHGGEPLLHPQFSQMVLRLKGIADFRIKSVSNGQIITEKLAREIVSSGIDEFEISLDGDSLPENDRLRGEGAGAKAVLGVRHLLQARADGGKSVLRLCISNTRIARSRGELTRSPQPAQYLVNIFGSAIDEFKCTWALRWPGMRLPENLCSEVVLAGNTPSRTYCDHIINTTTIRWDGTVVPCCYDITNASPVGNIMDTPFEDIWNSVALREIRRSIASGNAPALCDFCNVIGNQRYLLQSHEEPPAMSPDTAR